MEGCCCSTPHKLQQSRFPTCQHIDNQADSMLFLKDQMLFFSLFPFNQDYF
jgi:hypothetical protein